MLNKAAPQRRILEKRKEFFFVPSKNKIKRIKKEEKEKGGRKKGRKKRKEKKQKSEKKKEKEKERREFVKEFIFFEKKIIVKRFYQINKIKKKEKNKGEHGIN